MQGTRPDPADVQALRDACRGPVLEAGDQGYDDARALWNGMVDRRPGVVVRCHGPADVMQAVGLARERGLPLAVKGGGHNVAGKSVSDGGVTIDLGLMRSVRVDPGARTVRAGGGATWGDLDHETQAFGLATTGGLISTTGLGGLTLGGGIGYLARSYGLALDNLIGADVVTADGRLVHASEEEHPDLFWGLRGGGGNFGVVTSLEYRLHEVGPELLVAQAFHPFDAAQDVLRFYRDFTADAPREVACYGLVGHVPPAPPFPAEWHGKVCVAMVAMHSGSIEAARPHLEPVGDFGDPILAAVQPMPYVALQQTFDAGTPKGGRYYWKSHYLDELDDGLVDLIVERANPLPGPFSLVGLEPLGGAVADVGPTETAFPRRDAAFSFGVWAGWESPDRDDEAAAWTRDFFEAAEPYAGEGIYSNYLDRDEDDRAREAFGANYERLVEVKNRWDPENLFRLNTNVVPTAPAASGA